jgi:transcriptional regulator with XRE-family HTH domain
MSELIFSRRLITLQGDRSQKDFAAWLDVSPSRLNNYLRGVNLPDIDFLSRLAAHGINVNWFLLGKGPVHVEPAIREGIPENVQVLLKEIADEPGVVEDLTAIVRSKKEMEQSFTVLKNVLKRRKTRTE